MLINRAPILMIQWGAANELNELESIEDRFAELSVPILYGAVYREVVANEAFRESVVRRAMGYEGDELQDWTPHRSACTVQQTHEMLQKKGNRASSRTRCTCASSRAGSDLRTARNARQMKGEHASSCTR